MESSLYKGQWIGLLYEWNYRRYWPGLAPVVVYRFGPRHLQGTLGHSHIQHRRQDLHIPDHMMLEATELGLGTVWVCYFQPDVIRKEFDLPDNLEPINILVIGYGNEAPSDTERHEHMRIPLTDLVSYEKL